MRSLNRCNNKYIWHVFFAWISVQTLASILLFNGLFNEFLQEIYTGFAHSIPSIAKIRDHFSFGLDLARSQAVESTMLSPLLYLSMMLIDVNKGLDGVRKKGSINVFITSAMAASLAVALLFFSGFDNSNRFYLYKNNFFIFSFVNSLVIYGGCYLLRISLCLLTEK